MAEIRTSATAEDTLKAKSRDPNIVYGGYLVAEALTRQHTLDLAAHVEKNWNFFE